MWSEVIRQETVTLESIGPVTGSLIEMWGDGHIRPYRYLEFALLWDEHNCHIVDSNTPVDQKDYAVALFDLVMVPENLARGMFHVIHNVPRHEWEM